MNRAVFLDRDGVLVREIVIDGSKATITYLNAFWNPVTESETTMVLELFEDGGKEI